MPRPVVLLIALGLCALGVLAAGCFEQQSAGVTVTNPVTVGVGTDQKEVSGAGGESASTATGETTSGETTTGETTTGETTTGETTTGETSTGGGGPGNGSAEVAAGKDLFVSGCGTCHTLSAAGTTGNVGPNLDELKPDEQTVRTQIMNGGAGMPAGIYTGADADTVAKYVSSVAGQ